jgi:hypothetical protein
MIKNNNYSINPITFNSDSNSDSNSNSNSNLNYFNIDNNFISLCDNNNNNINNIVSSYNNYDNTNRISAPYLNNNEFNKPKLIYNNISDKISVDILVEYVIIIESIDRDIEKYPNPFKYKIYFNPVAQTKDAYIYKTFENVKYIKLETAILPRKYSYFRKDITSNTTDVSTLINTNRKRNDNFTFNTVNYTIIEDYIIDNIRYIKYGITKPLPELIDKVYELQYNIITSLFTLYEFQLINLSLEDEKFLLLNIDEIKDVNDMATNTEVSNAFSILFPDYVNGDFFYSNTQGVDKIYRFSQLGNIKSLSVNILDNEGKDFNTQSYKMFTDTHISKNKKCICRPNSDGEIIRDYGCSCSYMRHPYYKKFQNTLLFKVGVIENDIDKSIIN